MKVIQILPEMNLGGVEFVTLELAQALVGEGHEAIVVSNGGQLVGALETCGARHIAMPVHRKKLASFLQVRKLRRFFEQERPDIIHIASRLPGWLAWLAWRGMDKATRPRLVSTVHGFYSVNGYSAVMTFGERVIAVSSAIKDYVLSNYPKTPADHVRVIHGGVDENEYPRDFQPSGEWLDRWKSDHPELAGKVVLLLPGRVTRWKGQEHFIRLVAELSKRGHEVYGLIAGAPHPRKQIFFEELKSLTNMLGISGRIGFLGSRDDLREVMAVSDVVFSLSLDPEAFGRVSLEAAALGRPVVGYNHGGVAEQLVVIFPEGSVPVGDIGAAVEKTEEILEKRLRPGPVDAFSLARMRRDTMAVYQEVLVSPR